MISAQTTGRWCLRSQRTRFPHFRKSRVAGLIPEDRPGPYQRLELS